MKTLIILLAWLAVGVPAMVPAPSHVAPKVTQTAITSPAEAPPTSPQPNTPTQQSPVNSVHTNAPSLASTESAPQTTSASPAPPAPDCAPNATSQDPCKLGQCFGYPYGICESCTIGQCGSKDATPPNPDRPYFDGYGNEFDYQGNLIAHGDCNAWATDLAYWQANPPTTLYNWQDYVNGTQQQYNLYCG